MLVVTCILVACLCQECPTVLGGNIHLVLMESVLKEALILGCQLHKVRCSILLEVLQPLGARNGKYILALQLWPLSDPAS